MTRREHRMLSREYTSRTGKKNARNPGECRQMGREQRGQRTGRRKTHLREIFSNGETGGEVGAERTASGGEHCDKNWVDDAREAEGKGGQTKKRDEMMKDKELEDEGNPDNRNVREGQRAIRGTEDEGSKPVATNEWDEIRRGPITPRGALWAQLCEGEQANHEECGSGGDWSKMQKHTNGLLRETDTANSSTTKEGNPDYPAGEGDTSDDSRYGGSNDRQRDTMEGTGSTHSGLGGAKRGHRHPDHATR